MLQTETDDLHHFIVSDKTEWRNDSTAGAQRVRRSAAWMVDQDLD